MNQGIYWAFLIGILLNVVCLMLSRTWAQWVNLAAIFILTAIFARALYFINKQQYPDPRELKIAGGIIHHPKYGAYPAEVEFKQGMTIHPGQSAIVSVPMPNE